MGPEPEEVCGFRRELVANSVDKTHGAKRIDTPIFAARMDIKTAFSGAEDQLLCMAFRRTLVHCGFLTVNEEFGTNSAFRNVSRFGLLEV